MKIVKMALIMTAVSLSLSIGVACAQGTLASGLCLVYFDDSAQTYLARADQVDKGERSGLAVGFECDGSVKAIDSYFFGVKQGLALRYWANGALKSIAYYQKGKRSGIFQEFGDKGYLSSIRMYTKGYLHGPAVYFDDNGEIVRDVFYSFGRTIDMENYATDIL